MNPHIGTSLDDFLEKEGILAETEAIALKRIIAFQLARAMQEQDLSKADLVRRMGTSRGVLDRLLDPDNPSVTLLTIEKAAKAVGQHIRIELAA